MRTHRITTMLDLDGAQLNADLARADLFRYNESYGEFICGSWRSCMLWNRSGDTTDAFLDDYDGPASITAYGKELPYLLDMVNCAFKVDTLKFGRLARLTPGSVLVPHRDYLELESDLTRIHIPLLTDNLCFSSEGETIYQMRLGEIWFIDATRIHSAASFSSRERVHLILDFGTDDFGSILRLLPAGDGGSIPEGSKVSRRVMTSNERSAFLGLASVIDAGNYKDVLAMIIKKYFTAELAVADIFGWLTEIATMSGRSDVLAKVRWQEEHCLVRR